MSLKGNEFILTESHVVRFTRHPPQLNYFSQTQPVLTLVKQLGGHFSIAAGTIMQTWPCIITY